MKTLTIRHRIWATLASLLALCAIGVGVTMQIEQGIVKRHDLAFERRQKLENAADQIRFAILSSSDALRGMLFELNDTDKKRKAEADDMMQNVVEYLRGELSQDSALANSLRTITDF